MATKQKQRGVRYAKWAYIFLIPFFSAFVVFTLIPLGATFAYSFFEMYKSGLTQVGPNFIGLENYKALLADKDLPRCLWNTAVMWVVGFVPQISVALILASLFANRRLALKLQGFFKTVVYMPNLIMATSFAMLFYTLFSDSGPINNILMTITLREAPVRFLSTVWGARGLVALMNFLMWYGNTTILLLAGILGIDADLIDAAEIDGAGGWDVFWRVTVPLLRPILVYVLITSLIGGLQMFDVPQILTNGQGTPNRSAMTVVMLLNSHLYSKNYGMAGAVSVMLFLTTAILSYIIFRMIVGKREGRRDA